MTDKSYFEQPREERINDFVVDANIEYKGYDQIYNSRKSGFWLSFDLPNPRYKLEGWTKETLGKTFSYVTDEMFLRIRKLTLDSYRKYVFQREEVLKKYNIITNPDLVYTIGDYYEHGTIIELKAISQDLTELEMNSINKKAIKQHAVNGREVIPIVYNPRREFIKKGFHSEEHIKIYNYILKNLIQLYKASPKGMLENLRDSPNDIELLKDTKIVKSGEEILEYFEGKISQWDSNYEDQLNDFLNTADRSEDFLNENLLIQREFTKVAYDKVSQRKETISIKHPFDRDKNRLFNETQHGNKSSTIATWPLFSMALGEKIESYINDLEGIPALVIQNNITPETQDKLRELNKELGMLLSMTKLEEEMKIETNEEFKSKREMKLKIDELYEEQQEVIKAANELVSEDVEITKHGGVRIKDIRELIKYHVVQKDVLKDIRNEDLPIQYDKALKEKDHLWCTRLEAENIINNLYDKVNLEVNAFNSFHDMYKGLGINDFDNTLTTNATSALDDLYNNKFFKYLYFSRKVHDQVLMDVPQHSKRDFYQHDMYVCRMPDIPLWIISTKPPNEITSGLVITISLHIEDLDDNLGLPPKQYCKKLRENLFLRVSKPYRFNETVGQQFNNFVGGFSALYLKLKSYEIEMPTLLASMFTSYTRQLSLVCDHLYLCYKNIFGNFTAGKNDMSSEFDDIFVKDMRVSSIVRSLYEDYEDFCNQVKGKFDNLIGSIDPVFGIEIRDIQIFQSLIYLKQIYPKVDGFDQNERSAFFLGADMKQNDLHHQSKFFDTDQVMANDFDFSETLFDGKGKWEAISYNPKAIYYGTKELLLEIAEEKSEHIDSFIDEPLNQMYKTSRVLIQNHLLDVTELPGSTSYVKSKSLNRVGLKSVELTEGLNILQNKIEDFKNNPANREELLNAGYKKEELEKEDKIVRSIDAIYFLDKTMPDKAIVSTKVKDQVGWSKRLFYIQDIYSYIVARFCDSSLEHLLKASKYDFLSEKGDEKFRTLEKIMSGMGLNPTFFTCDETKFGDMFPLVALMIMIVALYHAKFYNKTECCLVLGMLERLRGRLTLLPSEIATSLKQYRKGKINKFTPKVQEFLANITLNNNIFPIGEFPKEHSNLAGNEYITKHVGFVLGVLNRIGSLASAVHMKYKIDAIHKLVPNIRVDGRSHSDDSIVVIDFPLPRIDYRKVSLNNMLSKFDEENIVRFVRMGEEIVGIKRDRSQIRKINSISITKIISKLIVKIILTGSRLIGQRMSTKKFSVGSSGEILQHYLVEQKCFPSYIKPIVTCLTAFEYTSPVDDITNAVSRISPVMAYGCHFLLSTMVQFFVNWYISDYYGITLNSDSKYLPLELNGVWYVNPFYFQKVGFLGQEARLMALYNVNKEFSLYKKMSLLVMNTSHVLRDNKYRELGDASMGEKTTNIETPEESLMPLTRKRFRINYASNLNTTKTFFDLFDKNYPRIARDVVKLAHSEKGFHKNQMDRDELAMLMGIMCGSRELLKLYIPEVTGELKDYFSDLYYDPEILEKNGFYLKPKIIKLIKKHFPEFLSSKHKVPFIDKTLNLDRYLMGKFQRTSGRVRVARKLIGAHGFNNRMVVSPFKLTDLEGRDYKISDLIDEIKLLALTTKTHKLNEPFYEFCYKIFEQPINKLKSIRIDILSESKIKESNEFKKQWYRNLYKDIPTWFDYNPKDIVSAILEREKLNVPYQNLFIVREKPFYKLDPGFYNSIKRMEFLVKQYGFKGQNLRTNIDAIERIFTNVSYLRYFRCTTMGDKDLIESNTFPFLQLNCNIVMQGLEEEVEYAENPLSQSEVVALKVKYEFYIRQLQSKLSKTQPEVSFEIEHKKVNLLEYLYEYYTTRKVPDYKSYKPNTRILDLVLEPKIVSKYEHTRLFIRELGKSFGICYNTKGRMYIEFKVIDNEIYIDTNVKDWNQIIQDFKLCDKYINGNKFKGNLIQNIHLVERGKGNWKLATKGEAYIDSEKGNIKITSKGLNYKNLYFSSTNGFQLNYYRMSLHKYVDIFIDKNIIRKDKLKYVSFPNKVSLANDIDDINSFKLINSNLANFEPNRFASINLDSSAYDIYKELVFAIKGTELPDTLSMTNYFRYCAFKDFIDITEDEWNLIIRKSSHNFRNKVLWNLMNVRGDPSKYPTNLLFLYGLTLLRVCQMDKLKDLKKKIESRLIFLFNQNKSKVQSTNSILQIQEIVYENGEKIKLYNDDWTRVDISFRVLADVLDRIFNTGFSKELFFSEHYGPLFYGLKRNSMFQSGIMSFDVLRDVAIQMEEMIK